MTAAEVLQGLRRTTPDQIHFSLSLTNKTLSQKFSFPDFGSQVKEEICSLVSAHLRRTDWSACHEDCLFLVRILSRDVTQIDNLFDKNLIGALASCAGYLEDGDENRQAAEILEAVKGFCNLTFQAPVARQLFIEAKCFEYLCKRLKWDSEAEKQPESARLVYDIRLFFIMTARCPELRKKSHKEMGALKSLRRLLQRAMDTLTTTDSQEMAIELLKAIFNLTMGLKSVSELEAEEIAESEELTRICSRLLLMDVDLGTKKESLHSHAVNLLTSLPPDFTFKHVTWPKEDGFMGEDLAVVDVLLNFLNQRLDNSAKEAPDSLTPILVLLGEMARSRRVLRKYMRWVVLPPLGDDVMRRPEEGSTIRNKLTKLMSSVSETKDLAGAFLFELCKRNVERMIKYTGFGNSAGLLANFGLLGTGRCHQPDNMSPDEDSDTEEYLRVKPNVNPVVGCVEDPRPNPMAAMSDEQKEFEAMKLVEQIDLMMKGGVIQPATIGDDGRPRPVDHILELRPKSPTDQKTDHFDDCI